MPSPEQQKDNGNASFNTEKNDRKCKCACFYFQAFFSLLYPVEGCECPRNANTQKYIHGIGTSHISNRCISCIIIDSCNLGCKRIYVDNKLQHVTVIIYISLETTGEYYVDDYFIKHNYTLSFQDIYELLILTEKMLKLEKPLPGTEVPSATKDMAVTASVTPTVHPNWEAKSPMN